MNSADFQEQEVLWGYAKRLRFVRQAIADAFPGRGTDAVSVLDVGCGNGSHLALPLARLGFQVTGVDIDAASIEHARAMAADLDNAKFVCGDVSQFAERQSFDVVILSEVLEHTTEPGALLAASVRYLSPEGLVIVTVPNGFGEFEIDSWFFRSLRLQSLVDALTRARHRRELTAGEPASEKQKVMGATNNEESGHVQFFTRRRLRRLFKECNLRVVREGAASLFAGPLAGHTLARSARFVEWNARVTDNLPYALASGWYFALRREEDRNASTVDANGNSPQNTRQNRSQE
jgi:2-polyprenyl-3-methyl-5-hydroxy-6-metoxy-1,4-benzoquinol methylase